MCADPYQFGAYGDGVHDDTTSFRAALAACGAVAPAQMPVLDGTYLVSENLHTYRALDLPAAVAVVGQDRDNVIIRLAPGQRDSVRPWYVGLPGGSIQNMTIDGNKANQPDDDEHRAGIIIESTSGITVEHVTSHDNTGDAIYIGSPVTENVLISDFEGRDCDRDGVAITGGSFITVTGSYLHNNRAQNYDTEPGMPLHDLVLEYSTIDAGTADTTTYVLTMSGAGIDSSKHSYNLNVHDNTVLGPVFIVYLDNSTLANNTITQTVTNAAAVSMQGAGTNITISGNTIGFPAGTTAKVGIDLVGNGTVGQPAGILVENNTINANTNPNMVGVQTQNIHDVQILDNTINGNPASTINYGVSARAAAQGYPMTSLVIDGNTFYDFPTDVITWSGVTPTIPIDYVEANNNTFISDTGKKTTIALALNYNMGGGVYDNAVQAATADGDTLEGVATFIKPYPACPVN